VRALRGRGGVSRLADPRVRLAGLVAAAVFAADQATKAAVERLLPLHESVALLPFFTLTHVRNSGAAFGLLAAVPPMVRLPLFFAVTGLAAWVLVAFLRRTAPERRGLIAALGGILGGALGNLVCRIRYGAVIDFLDAHWGTWHWPAFNVADAAITVGVVLVLLSSRRGP
jgi:signal peptidase II